MVYDFRGYDRRKMTIVNGTKSILSYQWGLGKAASRKEILARIVVSGHYTIHIRCSAQVSWQLSLV